MTRADDEFEIRSLQGRYADAMITNSAAAAAACYAPDGRLQAFDEPVIVGTSALVENFEQVLSLYEFIFQMTHQGFVAFDEHDPDLARARWHISEVARRPASTSGTFFLGTYQDEVRRVDARWLFTSRTLRGTYVGRIELPGKRFEPFFSPWGELVSP
jgi:hypothetical protein